MMSLDALIFTAGIEANAPHIRVLCCRGLERPGMVIDGSGNSETVRRLGEISTPGSDVKVLVIPTNEELKIAQETMRLLERRG